MTSRPIRVRMAPSPTGFFHVGSARTALFNFLFARHTGGTFILRIEDTDQARGSLEYEDVIYRAMSWLGLDSTENSEVGGDFGPYRQSERFEIYREYAAKLLDSGHAYYAYETPEELAQMREIQAQNKQPPRYNGSHRELSAEQRAEFEAQGRRGVVRLKIPTGEVAFKDAVYGDIKWKNSDIDDFVICKSDGGPTYNFACVCDDYLMQISHVIRGEDGLSNTPRQCLIYDAFGWERPIFAHLPFLLDANRKKLSKRFAPVNLLDYSAEILPDAMFNYLALLGWNPGGGETQEVFSRAELIERFSLEGVNRAGAIFDPEKLRWMNIAHLKALPITEFTTLAAPHLEAIEDELNSDPEYGLAALDLARDRIHNLPDIARTATYFFTDEFAVDEAGREKHLTPQNLQNAAKLREIFAGLEAWDAASIEASVRNLSEELGVKVALLVHPTRMLVSGQMVGPSLWELFGVFGARTGFAANGELGFWWWRLSSLRCGPHPAFGHPLPQAGEGQTV